MVNQIVKVNPTPFACLLVKDDGAISPLKIFLHVHKTIAKM